MNPTLCSRCKKNVAVVYITRLDAPGQPGTIEGLCCEEDHMFSLQYTPADEKPYKQFVKMMEEAKRNA